MDEGQTAEIELPCDICYQRMQFKFCLQCNVKRVTCSSCTVPFSSFEKFRKHLKEHSHAESTPVECWINLRTKNTEPKRLYVCVRCSSFVCDKLSDFGKHGRMVHGKGKPYLCLHCERRYCYKKTLIAHIRTHVDEPVFQCNVCDKKFHTKSQLKYHEVAHESVKKHACQYCDKSFKSVSLVRRHMTQHTPERMFTCCHCDQSFLFHFTLKRHLLTHVNQGGAFKCDYCRKKYHWKGDLIRHIRQNHLKVGMHACSICDKKFSRKCYLVQHETSHSLAKAFMCFCGKTFRYQSNLTRHRRTHENSKKLTTLKK